MNFILFIITYSDTYMLYMYYKLYTNHINVNYMYANCEHYHNEYTICSVLYRNVGPYYTSFIPTWKGSYYLCEHLTGYQAGWHHIASWHALQHKHVHKSKAKSRPNIGLFSILPFINLNCDTPCDCNHASFNSI